MINSQAHDRMVVPQQATACKTFDPDILIQFGLADIKEGQMIG